MNGSGVFVGGQQVGGGCAVGIFWTDHTASVGVTDGVGLLVNEAATSIRVVGGGERVRIVGVEYSIAVRAEGVAEKVEVGRGFGKLQLQRPVRRSITMKEWYKQFIRLLGIPTIRR